MVDADVAGRVAAHHRHRLRELHLRDDRIIEAQDDPGCHFLNLLASVAGARAGGGLEARLSTSRMPSTDAATSRHGGGLRRRIHHAQQAHAGPRRTSTACWGVGGAGVAPQRRAHAPLELRGSPTMRRDSGVSWKQGALHDPVDLVHALLDRQPLGARAPGRSSRDRASSRRSGGLRDGGVRLLRELDLALHRRRGCRWPGAPSCARCASPSARTRAPASRAGRSSAGARRPSRGSPRSRRRAGTGRSRRR